MDLPEQVLGNSSIQTPPQKTPTTESGEHPGPMPIGECIRETRAFQRANMPPETPEQKAARELAEQKQRDRQKWQAEEEIRSSISKLFSEFGSRYEQARTTNFIAYGDASQQAKQRAAVEAIREYGENIIERHKAGIGVVLFGSTGTGKDHLMACLLRAAMQSGLKAKWLNGMDFYGSMRDRMDSSATEESMIRDLGHPHILGISDPIPPWGPLTQFQAATLFRVIDRRYRDMRPIFVTINVAGGAEAADRLGAAVVDRLKEKALVIHCDWPSYRAKR